ncbi:hypothetical protein [Streptomyces sp. NPDC094437]|uniref:hypothetical protein n=1 Tax=Streptomyces sp. NPDC094437 TaxID=3366060 RepID=UPI003801FFBB
MPGTVLVLYLTALLAVAVHGASVGLRTRWSPPWSAWCCWRSRPGRRERPRRGVPLRGRPVPGREVHHRPLHGTGHRSFSLKACGSCTSYSLTSTLRPGFKPCDDSGKLSPGYVCTECAYTSGYGY